MNKYVAGGLIATAVAGLAFAFSSIRANDSKAAVAQIAEEAAVVAALPFSSSGPYGVTRVSADKARLIFNPKPGWETLNDQGVEYAVSVGGDGMTTFVPANPMNSKFKTKEAIKVGEKRKVILQAGA
jgi:hypothetical protein